MAKMIFDVKLQIRTIAIVAIFSLLSCGDKSPPVSQSPKPVSKKIATQAVAKPEPAEAKPSKAEPLSATVKPDVKPDVKPAETKTDQSQPGDVATSNSDLVEASLKEVASAYDPKGRFDPFEPLFKDEPEDVSVGNKKNQRPDHQKTPLERIALSQLKLSAVIRAPSGNRALVEDGTGKGYVVTNGTYMGLNSGKVVQIANDRIVVEEEVENVLGEYTLKSTELKLQKPAGEL
jgi:type IV pilus assembly protein PilP